VFGSTLDLTYTVANIGSDPATDGWTDRFYLSTDSLFNTSDRLLTSTPTIGTIPSLPASGQAGDSYTQNVALDLPLAADLPPGTYYIFVQTDAGESQAESNEGNNVRLAGAFRAEYPLLPDLVVESIVAPVQSISNEEIEIRWTIRNRGDGDFTGTMNDRLLLSTDPNVGGDQFFGNFAFTGAIAAGESIERIQRITLPLNFEGDYWAVVSTDVNNNVAELTGEGNNTTIADQPVSVQLAPIPDLQVTAITPPDEAFSGQSTLVEWVVTNTGNGATSAPIWYDRVYLSTDTTFDDADAFLARVSNPTYLEAGDSYANSAAVTLPLFLWLSRTIAVAIEGTRLERATKVLLLIPAVTTVAGAAVSWYLLYNPDYGLVVEATGLSLPWQTAPWAAMAILVAFTLWQNTGYGVLVLSAALRGIPGEIKEAAVVDGATDRQLRRYVVYPLLRRSMTFLVVIGSALVLQSYTAVYLLTRGGPYGSTRVAGYYLYETAFERLRLGYGAAATLLVLALVVTVAALEWWWIGRDDR
jgi:ABC-type sugar transport system permease subunit